MISRLKGTHIGCQNESPQAFGGIKGAICQAVRISARLVPFAFQLLVGVLQDHVMGCDLHKWKGRCFCCWCCARVSLSVNDSIGGQFHPSLIEVIFLVYKLSCILDASRRTKI